jgi:hypothetical protein
MLEYSINLSHHKHLHDTSVIAKKSGYMERLIREVIEIELYPDNMNKEEGYSLIKSWRCLV